MKMKRANEKKRIWQTLGRHTCAGLDVSWSTNENLVHWAQGYIHNKQRWVANGWSRRSLQRYSFTTTTTRNTLLLTCVFSTSSFHNLEVFFFFDSNEVKDPYCSRSVSSSVWPPICVLCVCVCFLRNRCWPFFTRGEHLWPFLLTLYFFCGNEERKRGLPSRLIPTAMHFLSRQYWHRLRLMRRMEHCWFLVHGRYWIFCWILLRKKPYYYIKQNKVMKKLCYDTQVEWTLECTAK